MRKSLKVSRGVQIFGCLMLIVGIVSCSQGSDTRAMSQSFLVGFIAIIGARIYEWMSKD